MKNKTKILEVNNVFSGYGETEILHGVSIEIYENEIVTIIGPNGCGKSTLMKTIFGLLRATSGNIDFMIDNKLTTINNFDTENLIKQGLSYVPQSDNVFPSLSIEENLEMGSFIKEEGMAESIESMYELFPVLKEKRNDPASQLSGGQRQMLAFARAMMLKPKLIILDEPSAGLAPNLVNSVFETILTIHKAGVAVLMVEQNAKAALERSNRGYVLATGENKAEGTGKSLLKNKEIASLYLGGK
ncbi:MAG: ABC transporter ATP-binding protein [Chloroflexi bacterium]|nr:ABC transporter ATP-binding protein [Chloroflexota bacterium]|tara:strand:+ start:5646 stop:6377 length:732 start_codon:yes stop_codon:yes gene_type:complete